MKNQKNIHKNAKLTAKLTEKLIVYYDGLCKVCSTEINHYKRQQGAENISFIDICSAQFDALKENLDPLQIHKIMHVRRPDGTIATRVDAFIEIWKVLPKYSWAAKIAKNSLVNLFLQVGYSGFVAVRPILPRYKKNIDCEARPYCEVKNV